MRYQNRKQAERKATLLGVGWSFSHCHWSERGIGRMGLMSRTNGTKNPEDRLALRGQRVTSSLAASAAIVTAIIAAPTRLLAAMGVTALVAVVVVPSVSRRDIHDRRPRRGLIYDYRRAAHDGRRAIRHRRRARRRVNHDRTRGGKDWQRQPEREVHRNSCLGGAGQSEHCNHCYQTEQMFCFHGGSDGAVRHIFDSKPLIKQEDH
jgi:hypothetical protein